MSNEDTTPDDDILDVNSQPQGSVGQWLRISAHFWRHHPYELDDDEIESLSESEAQEE